MRSSITARQGARWDLRVAAQTAHQPFPSRARCMTGQVRGRAGAVGGLMALAWRQVRVTRWRITTVSRRRRKLRHNGRRCRCPNKATFCERAPREGLRDVGVGALRACARAPLGSTMSPQPKHPGRAPADRHACPSADQRLCIAQRNHNEIVAACAQTPARRERSAAGPGDGVSCSMRIRQPSVGAGAGLQSRLFVDRQGLSKLILAVDHACAPDATQSIDS